MTDLAADLRERLATVKQRSGGLLGMQAGRQARLAAAGGRLEVDSAPRAGTTVRGTFG